MSLGIFDGEWEKAKQKAEADPSQNGHANTDKHSLREFVQAYDLATRILPENDRLLGDLLVRGHRTIIAAPTGEGKSTFCFHIIKHFLNQTPLLGEFEGVGGKVLYIDGEQSVREIKRLLAEVAPIPLGNLDFYLAPDGLELDRSEMQCSEIETLFDKGNYDLVVIDPFYKMYLSSSNDDQQMLKVMKIFDRWRTRYGFSLLMPAHTRKLDPKAEFSIDDIFGSTTFVRGAEVVLGLRFREQGFSQLYFFKDRSGVLETKTHWDLGYEKDRGFFKVNLKPKDFTTIGKIRDVLNKYPLGCKMERIIDESGFSHATVKRCLREMGIKANRDDNTYRLSDDDDS